MAVLCPNPTAVFEAGRLPQFEPTEGARVNASEDNPNASERESTRAKRRPRSAVTSGRRLLIGGNPNSAWARRYRDLVAGHASDLGGRSELSEAELSLIRRAAALDPARPRLR